MSGIEAKVIQELGDQIVALKETIEKTGNKARDNLKTINVEEARNMIPRDAAGKFDENRWAALKDEQTRGARAVISSLRVLASCRGSRWP